MFRHGSPFSSTPTFSKHINIFSLLVSILYKRAHRPNHLFGAENWFCRIVFILAGITHFVLLRRVQEALYRSWCLDVCVIWEWFTRNKWHKICQKLSLDVHIVFRDPRVGKIGMCNHSWWSNQQKSLWNNKLRTDDMTIILVYHFFGSVLTLVEQSWQWETSTQGVLMYLSLPPPSSH